MKDTNAAEQKGRLEPIVGRLRAAWNDMQRFGSHDGNCDFNGVCSECGTPQGTCSHHREAVKKRTDEVSQSLSDLELFIAPNA